MLLVENIEVYYGKICAIKEVSLSVDEGKLVLLLGANGTGKTTILNTISGFLCPRRGTIHYEGERTDKLRPDEIVKMGIVQVSQNRDLFPVLTVLDNLLLGAVLEKDSKTVEGSLSRVFKYFPRLREREKQLAGALSGGEQQMLAIGRALMSQPKLLLLDEPTTGVAPLLVAALGKIIRGIKEERTTILLVEQNAVMAVRLADYYYVLREGKVVKEGLTGSLPENIRDYFREYYI
jgi:branched-chain amino acid transport system ATP-binding protein